MLINEAGETITDEEARRRLKVNLERTGRIILGSPVEPAIGSVRPFAGLPMRVVRIVSIAEAQAEADACTDLWGAGQMDWEDSYFEVEVAD